MFRGGEVVFNRCEIRLKTANTAEIKMKLEELPRHLLFPSLGSWSDLETFVVPSQVRDFEA